MKEDVHNPSLMSCRQAKEQFIEQEVAFERCVDFLARMIEKYSHEILKEIQDIEEMEEKQRQAVCNV